MPPTGFRPTLAYKVQGFDQLRYPVLASPKIDGIRCVFFDQAYSRTLKPIRNRFVQSELHALRHTLFGMDGELVLPGAFNEVASGIMSEEGQPDFTFEVFDNVEERGTYLQRLDAITKTLKGFEHVARVRLVPQEWIGGPQELMGAEVRALQAGFEGLMIRNPAAPYKHGRSTEREGFLGKIKRFLDAEAEVVGFEPLLANNNPRVRNELGLTSRSQDHAGLAEQPLLGKLLLRDLASGREFGCGSGFTARQRIDYWHQRDSLPGRLVKYKYLPHGMLELPRHPIFLGFRDKEDL